MCLVEADLLRAGHDAKAPTNLAALKQSVNHVCKYETFLLMVVKTT